MCSRKRNCKKTFLWTNHVFKLIFVHRSAKRFTSHVEDASVQISATVFRHVHHCDSWLQHKKYTTLTSSQSSLNLSASSADISPFFTRSSVFISDSSWSVKKWDKVTDAWVATTLNVCEVRNNIWWGTNVINLNYFSSSIMHSHLSRESLVETEKKVFSCRKAACGRCRRHEWFYPHSHLVSRRSMPTYLHRLLERYKLASWNHLMSLPSGERLICVSPTWFFAGSFTCLCCNGIFESRPFLWSPRFQEQTPQGLLVV